MANRHATVLIAGGSIAGLALANMLEAAGIDYLVLEKYPKIAPDLGASIAIFSNAARILDQLGCYSGVEEIHHYEDVYDELRTVNPEGKHITSITNTAGQMRQRNGYQMIFIDRQQLVQILYDNLKDKSRVLPSHAIADIRRYDGGVEVSTANGSKFTGEILVGADGIHSVIRKEMWETANREHPGELPIQELEEVPTEWRIIYGISKPGSGGYPRNFSGTGQGNDYSYLSNLGPEGKVYWFLMEKLQKKVHGLYEKVPRYTDKDLEELVSRHKKDFVTSNIRLEDLYNSRKTATLQALPEMTLSKWHYGRTVLMGDAAHKFNPIGGQGGATAIEDAAVLANLLYKLHRSRTSKDSKFTDQEVTTVFTEYQNTRFARAQGLQHKSHKVQDMSARQGFLMKFMSDYVMPYQGQDAILEAMTGSFKHAARIDFLDVPHQPHIIPFDDELPARPLNEPEFVWPLFVVTALAMIVAGLKTVVPPTGAAPPDHFLGLPIQERFTGIEGVDKAFGSAGPVFSKSLSWDDVGFSLQTFYLLFLLFPIFVVWYTEAYRRASKWSLISCPLLLGLAMHPFGIGVIMPLYCLFGLFTTRNAKYAIPIHASIPPSIAKALLPANLIGLVLPTVALSIGKFFFITHLPNALAFWLIASVTVSALIPLFAKILATDSTSNSESKTASLPALKATFSLTALLTGLFHVATVIYITTSSDPTVSFSRLILPTHDPLASTSSEDLFFTGFFVFLKWDLLWAVLGVFFWGCYSLYELRRRGLVTTKEVGVAVWVFVFAQILVGPGAALAGLYVWREERLVFAAWDGEVEREGCGKVRWMRERGGFVEGKEKGREMGNGGVKENGFPKANGKIHAK